MLKVRCKFNARKFVTAALAIWAILGVTGPVAAQSDLSPAQLQEVEEYSRELQKQLAPLQAEALACGSNQRCLMEVMSRMNDAIAGMQLPAVQPYQARDCGLIATHWQNCVNVELSFKYSYDSGSYSEFPSGVHQTRKQTLAFSYKAPGVLAYDDGFGRFRLYQRRPPLLENIQFQDGRDIGWVVDDGVRTIAFDHRLGQVNWTHAVSPMIAFFRVEAEDGPAPAELTFFPPAPDVSPAFGDSISGQPVPPDGYESQPVDRGALKSLLQPNGTWRFERTYQQRYEDIGSAYLLRFTATAAAIEPDAANLPPAVSKSPPPEKKPGRLRVSPTDAFVARRLSAKEQYKPRSKSYVVSNTGETPVQFAVSVAAPWATPDVPSGTLAPNGAATVTIRLESAADGLGKGRHETVAGFRNVSNGLGSAQRKVSLRQSQLWRFSIYGHNIRHFGSGQLIGGLRVAWRTDVNFEVEDGKYKSGKGRTYFVGLDSYSVPPGVFACKAVKGEYLDKSLKSHPTPYIRHTSYSVSGHVAGGYVTLNLPPKNLYAVGYDCVTDVKALKQNFTNPQKYPKGFADYLAKITRKEAKVKDAYPLPGGAQKGQLKDGWIAKKGTTASIDFDAMSMKRLQ